MKILFFCGSVEPGRDGVGDYTRRLAFSCVARGHACAVIALHDPHVDRTADQNAEGVRLIRLPATDPWPDRLATAGEHLRRFAPDGVSWQFVAYGFHPRGFLPAALLRSAPHLRGSRCHVMLHELWLGLERGSPWRARAVGWLQRRGVLCLLEQLEPDGVQTSNDAYRRALAHEGVEAVAAGLFGNVPLADEGVLDANPLSAWVPAVAGSAAPLVAITFGTLHPQWHPAATVRWLLATARRLGRPPALVALGRAGAHAAKILQTFRQAGVTVAETGELDATTVSRILRAADCGIAPHPWALIGKSGAAAAMLEHGLPVLVPRDDWHLRGHSLPLPHPSDPLLARLADLDDARTDRWLSTRRSPWSGLPRATDTLLEIFAPTAAARS